MNPQSNDEPNMHSRLGALRWKPLAGLWYAAACDSPIRDQEIGIADSPKLAASFDLAADFLDWIGPNFEAFKAEAASGAFNYDLIWDENLDELALAAKFTIQSVNVRGELIEVWLDTAGVTTDHLLLAKLNGLHKIVGMEL